MSAYDKLDDDVLLIDYFQSIEKLLAFGMLLIGIVWGCG